MLEKKRHVELITNIKSSKCNFAVKWNAFEHKLNVRRLVGPQAAQARPEWAMLVRGRSLLGQSSRYLAMMTRPVLTKPFKA